MSFLILVLAGCPATKTSKVAQTAVDNGASLASPVSLLPAMANEMPLNLPGTVNQSLIGGTIDGGTISNPNGNSGGHEQGTIASPAQLTLTPTQYNFGVQSLRSFAYHAFTVKNIGGRSATEMTAGGLRPPFMFKGGNYPGAGGSCAASLAPNTTCTVVIEYSPLAMGKVTSDDFMLSYNNGTLGLHLEGSGTDIATLNLSNDIDDRDSFNYGTLPFGSSINHVFKVQYWGARPATGVSFSGASGAYTIVWNHCPTEISADCELAVRFTGANTGLVSSKLKVTYNNNAYAAETHQVLSGTTAQEVTQAVLSVDDADFGRSLVGSPIDRTMIVRKRGTRPAAQVAADALGGAFVFKGGNYPGVGGTCAATITTDCTVVMTFNPTSVVAFRDTLRLRYESGNGAATAEGYLSGLGATPASLGMSGGAGGTDFGNIPVHKPSDKTITITNTDGGVKAVGIGVGSVTAPFQLLNNCSDSLAPGQSCNVTVRFNPTQVGPANGQVTVTYFDGTGTKTVSQPLSGSGDGGALIQFTQSTADAGGVRIGMQQLIEVDLSYYGVMSGGNCTVTGIDEGVTTPGGPMGPGTPVGNGSGASGGFGYPGGGTYPGAGGTCSHTIDSPCAIKIVFIPTEVKRYTTTLVVSYDNGSGQTKTTQITLKGNGLGNTPASLSFASPSSDFGSNVVGSRKQVQVNVHRSGDLSATSLQWSSLAAPFRFEGTTCGTNMTTSDCKVTLSFAPTTAGVWDTNLTLAYFDGSLPQQTSLALHGTGYDAAYLVATAPTFAKTQLGASSDAAVMLENRGTRAAAAIALVSAPTDPFAFVSTTCGSDLAAGASCAATVRFTPVRPGAATGAMRYSYDSGVASVNVDVALAAAGAVPVMLGANGDHSCARLDDGSVKCWGHNNYGQLGQGDAINRGDAADPAHALSAVRAVNLGAGRYAKAVTVGYWHSCAILDNDSLKCWGSNNYGQLGLGSSAAMVGATAGEMGDALAAVNLGSGVKPVAVAAGYAHTCAVLDSGALKCWGYNGEGQLGLGDTVARGAGAGDMGDALHAVELAGRALSVTASTGHTCAMLDGGAVKCWGNNFFGQLGQEDFANRGDAAGGMGADLRAVDLGAGRVATAVSAGGAFTCAMLDNGAVKCWGRNEAGILGRNWCQDEDGVAGECGGRYALPLRGYGLSDGQMGDALPTVALGAGRTATGLSAANSNVCAMLDNGAVKCWGDNSYGQLGNAAAVDSAVADLGGVASTVAAGGFHACAAMANGALKCWGDNRYGELGLGDTENRGDAPNEMGTALAALQFY